MLRATAALLVGSLVWPAGASEELRYEWQITGIARLILPGAGSGTLSTRSEGGRVRTELSITADATDDYFRYGSNLDSETGNVRSAWSAYRFGKREKNKDQEIEGGDVVDIAAGILKLRHQPPTSRQYLTIWSDGRLYPVVVENLGREQVELASGGIQPAIHYSIRGRKLVGAREWKGSLDLWLGLDEASTPLKIEVARSFSRVELRLRDAG